MKKLVLVFDADGVIVSGKKFSQHLEDDHGITRETTSDFFTGVFNDCLEGKADLKEIIEPYLEKWGWGKSTDDFLDYWFDAEHSVDMELIEMIQELRKNGTKCFVATNQETYRTEYMRSKMNFDQWFDDIFSSAYFGVKKPHKSYYQQMIDKIGEDKQSIWFFDDTKENIDSANEFGINAVHYTDINVFKSLVRKNKWLDI